MNCNKERNRKISMDTDAQSPSLGKHVQYMNHSTKQFMGFNHGIRFQESGSIKTSTFLKEIYKQIKLSFSIRCFNYLALYNTVKNVKLSPVQENHLVCPFLSSFKLNFYI